jgi:hypothetical protein
VWGRFTSLPWQRVANAVGIICVYPLVEPLDA